ncbi:hypothetical protein PsW64_02221 [Pseudovibrio sp. W64]|uniref:DUF2780 domain-containing protein n=1 Tax=unclassified Pseudovibrio TaxID=2627060 RepID=UPI0007B1B1DE|nr:MULTISPECIES: DUF2780 domain-containing protein [unclassified Pseudovibrio]KZK81634.1 hypothetical protein PsW64_02221 [Pseudovibrio sp. W64]KZK83451.1 hypothetical protein PsAD13_02501 [Pseudovibrio sp. Ad13]KZK86344.1 hypothetical protein PsAD46_02730 [Pseudovibrio sp. Ad46]KZK92180.1 hypothetical protein PsAD5_03935 [Pseudovibrio sp. Ad5]KZK94894.1 hypothetical protein PsW74_04154 [Pseudovibrio sp. W74]
MHVLVDRITERTGLDPEKAQPAVGIMLNFIAKNSSKEEVEALLEAFPAAEGFLAIDEATENKGLLGGLASKMNASVGVLAALNEMTSLGLSVEEIQQVAKETVQYTREKVGPEMTDEIVARVPGLAEIT